MLTLSNIWKKVEADERAREGLENPPPLPDDPSSSEEEEEEDVGGWRLRPCKNFSFL